MELVDLNELDMFPIRTSHYDRLSGSSDFIYGVETVIEYAKKITKVDAIQVVRCGECRHHRPIDYCELHKCKGWFNDKHCSYGEPRTPPAE